MDIKPLAQWFILPTVLPRSLCYSYVVVFTMRHFSLTLPLVLLFNIAITSLEEERADLYASRVFVC